MSAVSFDFALIIGLFTTRVPVFFWPSSHNYRDIELKFCLFS